MAYKMPPEVKENPLGISWHDTAWIQALDACNVMDYFSERSNPFYDRTCNNEIVKMQRLSPDQLTNMTGLEYILLHAQEPILYVIRKQHRHSPTQVTPLTDYYILAGVVYQAPDLNSVFNSRMLTTVHYLQSAFEEASSFARYHPFKGYWWEFKDQDTSEKEKGKDKAKEEPSSIFQRRRVDMLLNELAKQFPPKIPAPPTLEKQAPDEAPKPDVKPEVKVEKQETSRTATTKPPPEKRPRLAQ